MKLGLKSPSLLWFLGPNSILGKGSSAAYVGIRNEGLYWVQDKELPINILKPRTPSTLSALEAPNPKPSTFSVEAQQLETQ